MMYLSIGIEENLDDSDGNGMPWQRAAKRRNLDYWWISKNGIYSSDA